MKPRNKFEKAVLAELKNLRPVTKTQRIWAFRECIDHFAYRLPKGRITCMACGHSWTIEKTTEHCTRPHCRAKLQVRTTFECKIRQKQYFTILTTCGEYQVLKMFLLSIEMEKGCKVSSYTIEIGRYWWNAQGRKTIVAVQKVLGKYIDTFSYCSPVAVRNDNEAYHYIYRTLWYIRSSRQRKHSAEMGLGMIFTTSHRQFSFLPCYPTVVRKHCWKQVEPSIWNTSLTIRGHLTLVGNPIKSPLATAMT